MLEVIVAFEEVEKYQVMLFAKSVVLERRCYGVRED